MVSRKLVAIPMTAKTHIQNMAPGPPTIMAMIGPVMFPTPIREPMLMQKTWNEDSLPSFLSDLSKKVTLIISLRPEIWISLRRTVA